MSRLQKLWNRIGAAAAVGAIVVAGVLSGAPDASATDPRDAPPGYSGPNATCPGGHYLTIPLPGTSGYVEVFYSVSNGGTFCARTFDNLAGEHHIEVIVQRDDWQTRWYDSGSYTTYAGAISVFGVDSQLQCAKIFGRVRVNGVNHDKWEHVC